MRAIARSAHQTDRRRPLGRHVAVGVAGATLLGAMTLGSPAVAQDGAEPGKGNAYAQGYKIDPQNGQLSFGITYGQALAGHQNVQAIGEARSLDLGVIGVTLAAEGCDGGDPTLPEDDQPHPLVSRTDVDGGGPESKEEHGVQRSVDSNENPEASATAITAGTPAEIPFSIGGSTSNATSGLIDGRRTARAVTDVADFVIPDVLEITGMRWVAEYQTEPEEKIITNFSIEGIKVADIDVLGQVSGPLGDAVPLPDLKAFNEPVEQIDQINALLEPLGISIQLPRTFVESGIAFVQPMRIGIAPAHQAIGDVFTAIQPVREALTGALFDLDCGTQSLVTVADIVAGSVSGAGALNLELGGVTATSGDIELFDGFGGLGLPSLPPVLPTTPPSFTTPSQPNSNFGAPTTPTGNPTVAAPAGEAAAPPATDPISSSLPLGVRGGPMLGVGLGVLALLGALAEGDRRKMRKAQRSVPLAMVPVSGSGGDAG